MRTTALLLALVPLLARQEPVELPRGGRARVEPDPHAPPDRWIRCELWRSAYVFLRGTVNGVETEMLLDTEAGITTLDRALAARVGLPPALEELDPHQTTSRSASTSITLGLGSRQCTLASVVVLDVGGPCSELGRDVPVILGRDVLDRFVVDLDPSSGRLALEEPDAFVPPEDAQVLALLTDGGAYRVEARIEDQPPALFRIDTGSRGLVLRASGLESGRRASTARTHRTTLRAFTLGGWRFRDVPAAVTDEELTAGAPQESGSIGAELLTRFHVTLDAPHGRLYLRTVPGWDARPFVRNRLGLEVRCRGEGLEVRAVVPESPAERDGWKAGDRVTALDGRPLTSTDGLTALQLAMESLPGTVVRLTDGEGREHRLVASDPE